MIATWQPLRNCSQARTSESYSVSERYTGISTGGTLIGAIAQITSPGIITITWTNTSGANINSPPNGIDINFIYTGATPTNLEFYPGNLITSNTLENIPVTYFNGVISPGTAQGTASLGTFNNAVQGQFYEVPLDFNFHPHIPP